MRRLCIWSAVVLICVGLGIPAVADQNDPRLDGLITALKAAPSEDFARPIEEQILAVWIASGDKAVDGLMMDGVVRLNRGDSDAALGIFDQVVTLAPDFAEGWNKRATTLYMMGRFADSTRDIDRVLKLEPRHFGALSGLGLCDLRLGKEEEALSAFRRAAAIDPYLPGVQKNIEALRERLMRDSL